MLRLQHGYAKTLTRGPMESSRENIDHLESHALQSPALAIFQGSVIGWKQPNSLRSFSQWTHFERTSG